MISFCLGSNKIQYIVIVVLWGKVGMNRNPRSAPTAICIISI